MLSFKKSIQQMTGYNDFFSSIIDFIKLTCVPIHNILKNVKGLSNILVFSWDCIIKFIMKEFALLFHVSSPTTFFTAYDASNRLIKEFESLLDSDDDISYFHGSVTLKEYLKKWPLSVYFQLMYHLINLAIMIYVLNLKKCLILPTKPI